MGNSDAHPYQTFKISEHLFRLTTESLRLYSNETCQHQTLEHLLVARRRRAARYGDHDTATLKEHLSVVPTSGIVSITLNPPPSIMQYLNEVRRLYGKRLGVGLTLGDALSLILFDYIVEQKANQLLTAIDVDGYLSG